MNVGEINQSASMVYVIEMLALKMTYDILHVIMTWGGLTTCLRPCAFVDT